MLTDWSADMVPTCMLQVKPTYLVYLSVVEKNIYIDKKVDIRLIFLKKLCMFVVPTTSITDEKVVKY